MKFDSHIIRDPKICGGEPVIRGTRVTLRTLLASLAEGSDETEILEDFPAVTREDLKAVIAYAAASAAEDLQAIELKIRQLSPGEFSELRDWVIERDWEEWDRQIERDAASGKLEKLFEKARVDHRTGKSKEI